MRILLIEDTEGLGEAIKDHLDDEGYAVDWVKTLWSAESCIKTTCYDLVMLDLMLPDGNGLNLLLDIRRNKIQIPVIIMTAKDQVTDRVKGLNAGADDYLVKPFDLDEMAARVAAVCRRYSGNPNPNIVIGNLEVNLTEKVVYLSDSKVGTHITESGQFLKFLSIIQDSCLVDLDSKKGLYAFGAEIESNTVEVYISRLRKKTG
ncbi:MAG: response regulator [Nitrincola sp.]|nr:response regulator [Nitrincola sp.]